MKRIAFKVIIEVEDDFEVDEPQWVLEDAFANGSIVECNEL